MEPVQRTVPAFLAQLLKKAPLSDEKLAFAWKTSVGVAIARVSTVRLSSDGVIEVQCRDDQWRREIKRSMAVIKNRLTALLGAEIVRHVRVSGGKSGGQDVWKSGSRSTGPSR